jgi:hypothetical protein
MVHWKRQTAGRDSTELAIVSAINYANKIVLFLCNDALST